MRRAVIIATCLLSTLCAFAQQTILPKDPVAVAIAQQALGIDAPPISSSTGIIILGSIQLSGDSSARATRVYALGNTKVRTEIDQAGGTSVGVLNTGNASYQFPAGKVIRLNTANTLADRFALVPTLSLLAEYAANYVEVDYIGTAQIGTRNVQQIALSWSQADNAADQTEFLKRTRAVYSIDAATYQVVQMEYQHSPERNTNYEFRCRVGYSGYQVIQGRLVPTTVMTYVNDTPYSLLSIASYSEGADVSQISFTVQEATR
jgi:hypothetical protein